MVTLWNERAKAMSGALLQTGEPLVMSRMRATFLDGNEPSGLGVSLPPVIRYLPGAKDVQEPNGTWVVPTCVHDELAGSKTIIGPFSAEIDSVLPDGIRAVCGYSSSCSCGVVNGSWSTVLLTGLKISGVLAQVPWVDWPLKTTMRLSANWVTLGYQRGYCISALRVHSRVVGLNM